MPPFYRIKRSPPRQYTTIDGNLTNTIGVTSVSDALFRDLKYGPQGMVCILS
jgi:hypothetical protein